jgi:ATP-dependent Lon protease
MVVFPHMMAPFIVGRESSVHALEIALATPEKRIFLVAQRDPKVDEPMRDDLYDFGVVAGGAESQSFNGNIKVMVEG